MTGVAFFDTNVLAYLFDADAPKKKTRAQEIFDKEARAGRALVSTQVLQEFYVTVTRKLAQPLDEDAAEKAVRHLAVLPAVVEVSTGIVLSAVARSRTDRISFWDALIIEAALAGGAERLYSEDLQHGRTMNGMRIENPFLPQPSPARSSDEA